MYKQLENRLFMNSNEKYEWINRCVAVFMACNNCTLRKVFNGERNNIGGTGSTLFNTTFSSEYWFQAISGQIYVTYD